MLCPVLGWLQVQMMASELRVYTRWNMMQAFLFFCELYAIHHDKIRVELIEGYHSHLPLTTHECLWYCEPALQHSFIKVVVNWLLTQQSLEVVVVTQIWWEIWWRRWRGHTRGCYSYVMFVRKRQHLHKGSNNIHNSRSWSVKVNRSL